MKKNRTPERTAKIERVLRNRQKGLTLILSNIHDPHNVSAIYRSCDAFGVPEVHLHYTSTAFPTLGAKTSASARKWVRSRRHTDMQAMTKELQGQGFSILATSCSPNAKSLFEYDLTRPVAFVLGNEHSGVEEDFVPLVDGEVFIPMVGMIQSFNVSVAAAILLSEAARQRTLAGMYDVSAYSDEEMAGMLEEWLAK